MAFSSSSSSLSATPNVTPLIDVLLVLLIIFMVIVPATPHGFETLIPTPSPIDKSSAPPPTPLMLDVERSPLTRAVTYRLDGQEMDRESLRASMRQAWAKSPSRPLLISGDPALDYRDVVSAMEEANAAGLQTIGLLSGHAH